MATCGKSVVAFDGEEKDFGAIAVGAYVGAVYGDGNIWKKKCRDV